MVLRASLVVAVVALVVALLIPAVQQAQEAASEMECRNNMRQIGLALQNLHDTYQRFPATEEDGHSWRVRILPYMLSDPFYGMYRFEEPWNSSWNRELERRRITAKNKIDVVVGDIDPDSPYSMAEFLWQCPSDREPKSPHTNYVMLVGPHAAGRKEEGISLADITDDPATTIIVAEIAAHDIEWLEPEDLDVETMSLQINDPHKPSISSHHVKGPHVVFCDGSVSQLGPDLPPGVLKAMITIDGGEKIIQDENAPGGYRLDLAAEPVLLKDS
ncbi:DUF1559 domain-containing protein [Bremerella cremea]|uniref:DUF1559 domain-containing protein n=2 Tax=Pirellulales TaxID=2691354 RepID=A0A2S8FDM8_9BACT|nr:hypothetical protein C5Y83_23115 [Blastopirellula marina]RCS43616.1 DUF1559 domain-containing protein [Bremerella cremea]